MRKGSKKPFDPNAKPAMIYLNIRLEHGLKDKIIDFATKTGVTQSAVVRSALRFFFDQMAFDPTIAEMSKDDGEELEPTQIY